MSSPHCQPLTDLVTGTTGIRAAIHVSPEGLILAASPGLTSETADRWAAAMAALSAVSTEGVGIVGDLTSREVPWGYSVIEDRYGQTLVLVGSPDKSMLAVAAAKGADLGMIVGRLIELADQGHVVAVAA
ncbi:roadblock/LC7 domain-containing protein [Kitasatospora sp. NPDC001119]